MDINSFFSNINAKNPNDLFFYEIIDNNMQYNICGNPVNNLENIAIIIQGGINSNNQ